MEKSTLDILLIDDDEDDIFFTTVYLSAIKSIKTNVHTAKNYNQAVTQILSNPNYVCLVDYSLGAQNGVDLITECRSEGAKNFFILATGYVDEQLVTKAYNAGAYAVIKKDELNKDSLENCLLKIIKNELSARTINKETATAPL